MPVKAKPSARNTNTFIVPWPENSGRKANPNAMIKRGYDRGGAVLAIRVANLEEMSNLVQRNGALALRRILTEPGLAESMLSQSKRTAPQLLWSSVAAHYRRLADRLVRARLTVAA